MCMGPCLVSGFNFWVCCGWFFPGVWVCCGWMGCLPMGFGLQSMGAFGCSEINRAWEFLVAVKYPAYNH